MLKERKKRFTWTPCILGTWSAVCPVCRQTLGVSGGGGGVVRRDSVLVVLTTAGPGLPGGGGTVSGALGHGSGGSLSLCGSPLPATPPPPQHTHWPPSRECKECLLINMCRHSNVLMTTGFLWHPDETL